MGDNVRPCKTSMNFFDPSVFIMSMFDLNYVWDVKSVFWETFKNFRSGLVPFWDPEAASLRDSSVPYHLASTIKAWHGG